MNVTLEPATHETRDIVRHFFLEFFYTLSEYDDHIHINDFGLPIYRPDGPPRPGEGPRTPKQAVRANWWLRGEFEQYIIRADARPAGYAIVAARAPHLPPGVEYELLDFYIAPPYRRRGVGREAARLVFGAHRGVWVVYQLQRNAPAKAFWRRVIGEYTRGNFIQIETDRDVHQRFTN